MNTQADKDDTLDPASNRLLEGLKGVLRSCSQLSTLAATLGDIRDQQRAYTELGEELLRRCHPTEFEVRKEQRQSLWQVFWGNIDNLFAGRPDYRLWRRWVVDNVPPDTSLAWEEWRSDTSDVHLALLQRGLDSSTDLVAQWGTIAVLSRAISGYEQTRLPPSLREGARLQPICNKAYRVASSESSLPTLQGCELECELVRISTLAAMQEITYKYAKSSGTTCSIAADEVLEHIAAIERAIRRVQPKWHYLAAFDGPAKIIGDGRRLAPFKSFDYIRSVYNAFFNGSAIRVNKGSTASRQRAATKSYQMAYASWLNWRSARIGLERRLARCPATPSITAEGPAGRTDSDETRELALSATRYLANELESLRQLALHATFIDNHYFAAKVVHRLLEMRVNLPSWVAYSEIDSKKRLTIRDLSDKWARTARHTGFRIPDVCQALPDPNVASELFEYSKHPGHPYDGWGDGEGPELPRATAPEPSLYRYGQRIRLSRHWPNIDNEIRDVVPNIEESTRLEQPLRRAAEKLIANPQIASAQFRDALITMFAEERAEMKLAVGLLRTAPTPERMRTVTRVIRALHHYAPFCIDHEVQTEWFDGLREAFRSMSSSCQSEVALELHETLAGRMHTILARSKKAAAMLASEWFVAQSKRYTNDFLGAENLVLAPVDISGFHVIRTAAGERWSPVFASIADLGDRKVSVLVTAFDEAPAMHRTITLETDLTTAAQDSIDNDLYQEGDIPLTSDIEILKEILVAAVEGLCSKHSKPIWLMLSLPPVLGSLPWSLIVHRCAPILKRPCVVSIIPSVEWLAFATMTNEVVPRSPLLRMDIEDNDHDIQRLRELVSRTQDIRGSNSIAITVGHGDSAGPLPTVRAPEELTIQEWAENGRCSFNILHACWSGQVAPVGLGDMGQLPGLLLAFGSKVVCAPVVEVQAGTVSAVLQSHINTSLNSRESEPFASVFHRALDAEPLTGLYNVYGLIHTPLRLDRCATSAV